MKSLHMPQEVRPQVRAFLLQQLPPVALPLLRFLPHGQPVLSQLLESARIENLNLSLFGEATFLGKPPAPIATPKRSLPSKRRQLVWGFSSEGVLGVNWELI